MPRLADLKKRIEALERPHAAKIVLYWPGDGREPHPADAIALTWDDDTPAIVCIPHNGREKESDL